MLASCRAWTGQVRRRSHWMQRQAVRSATATGYGEAARRTRRSILPGAGIERAGRTDEGFSVRRRRVPGRGQEVPGAYTRHAGAGDRPTQCEGTACACAKRADLAHRQSLRGAGTMAGSVPRKRTKRDGTVRRGAEALGAYIRGTPEAETAKEGRSVGTGTAWGRCVQVARRMQTWRGVSPCRVQASCQPLCRASEQGATARREARGGVGPVVRRGAGAGAAPVWRGAFAVRPELASICPRRSGAAKFDIPRYSRGFALRRAP